MAASVTPFLMFEGDAEAAATLYVKLFKGAQILKMDRYGPEGPGPDGQVSQIVLSLAGREFICMNSPVRHEFSFTPSISMFVACEDEAEIDAMFAGLSDGGEVLMPMGAYGFSRKFGWVDDRFGVSWQLNLPNA